MKNINERLSLESKMIKKLLIALLIILMSPVANAQGKIDRTKAPKPGPAPAILIGSPVTYKLDNGITVLVVEDHHLPKVTASYFIDQGPISEGQKAGGFSIMGSMLGEGTTSKSKAEFDEAVEQMGSDVSLSGSGGSASSLTRYFDKTFVLMAEALRHPAFSKESFEKIKSQTITGLKAEERNASAISARVTNALAYGTSHPLGEFETEKSVDGLELDDIKKLYKDYVTPSRGYLTFVGDIKPAHALALAKKALGDWKGANLTLPKLQPVDNPAKTEINLVDVPTAVQAQITVENLVDLPMSSPDYFAVLLANQILGGGEAGLLQKNLRERHGFTYDARSSVSAGRFQTMFTSTTSVRNEKVDSAVIEILNELDTIRDEKVTAEELQIAKARYNGSFAMGLEEPARTASFSRNILINNLSKDFYKTYLQKMNAVTADEVQKVARKYFNQKNTRIVVVGKAEVLKPVLEKLNYPLKMYDKYAEPVTATSIGPVKSDLSANEVIDKYLKAIGGESEIEKLQSVVLKGKMEIHGTMLDYTQKMMAPNLQMTDITMNGQPFVHRAFNGKSGYATQMGNKKDFSEEELAISTETTGLVPQLYYQKEGYKLENAGIEKVGDNGAYKINVTSPSGKKSTEYFDVATGYLVKIDRSLPASGPDASQWIEFSNYKKVGGMMFPFTDAVSVQMPAGSQDFVINVDDITINSGVASEDFN